MQDKFRLAVQFAGAFVAATIVANVFGYFYFSPAVQIPNGANFTELKLVTSDHNPYGIEGYGNVAVDENGFVNSVDFPMKEARVLCLGSSQTEAQHVRSTENYVARLNAENPSLHAYNLGISGSTFMTTFIRMQPLKDNFPQAQVIVFEVRRMPTLEDLARMRDILASGDIPAKNIDWKAKNPLINLAARMPIPRLIYLKNLKGKANDPNANDPNFQKKAEDSFDAAAYEQTLREVLTLGKNIAGDTKIVILGLEELKLLPDGGAEIIAGHGEAAVFARVCDELGIVYVPTGEAFLANYTECHIHSYGFYNTAPNVGHLSANGHQTVAELLSPVLGGLVK